MRLKKGEDAKIDRINELVEMAQSDDDNISNEGLISLLDMFHPLILKLCTKWSQYFNDGRHTIISWDNIIGDAQYWFIQYTKYKYTIDGDATYNKFIDDHMDQRIRYIYSKEITYRKRHIFPDPDKSAEGEMDMMDNVIFNYSDRFGEQTDMTDEIINREDQNMIDNLAMTVMDYIDDETYFTSREAHIFKQCLVKGRTHQDVSKEIGISRARVSQIMNRIRTKIMNLMLEKPEWWEVF